MEKNINVFAPANITKLAKNQIFVFGSNKEGNHVGGAAKTALEKFGAIMGKGEGLQGQSYAIPTMGSFAELEEAVACFFRHAKENRDKIYLMTKIGCGIAGHNEDKVKKLFNVDTPINIYLPKDWEQRKYVAYEYDTENFLEPLTRIVRISDGLVGGYIGDNACLAQEGDCFVHEHATVFGNATVSDNAKVYDRAVVYGYAQVYSNAQVFDRSRVYGYAQVYSNAVVSDNAQVYSNAQVSDSAVVSDNAQVSDNAKVYDRSRVYGYAKVSGNAQVFGNAAVYDNAQVYGNAVVAGYAVVSGDAQVYGDAKVFDNAKVFDRSRVYGYAQVYSNAVVSSDAKVYGYAKASGNAKVSDNAIVAEASIIIGNVNRDITNNQNIALSLYAQTLHYPVNGEIILFKKVNKTDEKGVFTSCFDEDFLYKIGEIAKAKSPDLSTEDCASGLHASHLHYWNEGDTIIAVKIKLEDIITVQSGKVRCKAMEVIEEVKL